MIRALSLLLGEELALQMETLPLSVLIAIVATAVASAAIILRIIGNTFHGNRPPVDEGIPFVGGLIKFSKARVTCMASVSWLSWFVSL